MNNEPDPVIESTSPVRTRAVFFIPGFDPIGARRYRELYRTQGAEQADVSGYDLKTKGRKSKAGYYGWSAQITDGDVTTDADVTLLHWNDLVRAAMSDSVAKSYGQLVRTMWIYVSSGALFRLIGLRAVPMIIALYPAFMLLLYFNLAFWASVGVFSLMPSYLDFIAGLACFVGLMRFLHQLDQRKLYAFYLMSDYAYAARHGGRMPDPLRDRARQFARVIRARMGHVDEILIVGHSSGAALSVHVVAELLKDGPAPVSLLTLGQVIPMVSFLPTAGDLRRDLNTVAQAQEVFWVDVSAPSDGACFALSDPVAVSGAAPDVPVWFGPKILSAVYSRTLSEEQLKAHRRRFFRLHVQYLCCFGRPNDYDYFQITAGRKTLRDRFGWRGATASRIETVLSGYTNLDPK